MTQTTWNTALYENHAFVWQNAKSLLELLAPKPGERILDLGCGTGQLTEKIASTGVQVWGMDAASTMIEKARQNYPHLRFEVADARKFQVDAPLDAVFSNAVLHWIKEPDTVIDCVYQALKPGGRFVAEFGGKGNIKAIAQAISTALATINFSHLEHGNLWYFPSIGEYATRLEQRGFDVTFALLLDRPTPLNDGDSGIANWLRMFADSILSLMPTEQKTSFIQTVEELLKPTLYQDGGWIADYRRIRVVALKR